MSDVACQPSVLLQRYFFPESNAGTGEGIILLEPVSFRFKSVWFVFVFFFEGVGINQNWKIRNSFKFLRFVYIVITLVKISRMATLYFMWV